MHNMFNLDFLYPGRTKIVVVVVVGFILFYFILFLRGVLHQVACVVGCYKVGEL